MFVAGCAVGLRLSGSLAEGQSAAFNRGEFFEPSEEWGITRAIGKCRDTLAAVMPSCGLLVAPSFVMIYDDDDVSVLRLQRDDDSEPSFVVLAKLDATKGRRPRGETFPFWEASPLA